jgi:hypothetical protein
LTALFVIADFAFNLRVESKKDKENTQPKSELVMFNKGF